MYPIIDKKKTAKRIQRIMKTLRKTPEDIQKYLGLSCVQTVYRWLEGINIPSIDNLYALSQWFRIPMDAMIVGSGDQGKQPLHSGMHGHLWIYYDRFMQAKVYNSFDKRGEMPERRDAFIKEYDVVG